MSAVLKSFFRLVDPRGEDSSEVGGKRKFDSSLRNLDELRLFSPPFGLGPEDVVCVLSVVEIVPPLPVYDIIDHGFVA